MDCTENILSLSTPDGKPVLVEALKPVTTCDELFGPNISWRGRHITSFANDFNLRNTPITMEALTAAGMTLEPLMVTHAEEMFEILLDPAIYQFENQAPESPQALAARYARLQRRSSPDGNEIWLNWAIRLDTGQLCGYVQATIGSDHCALIAYELASRFWNQKIGSRAVAAMLEHLTRKYAIRQFVAVFKRSNFRSEALLHSLGFTRFKQEPCRSLEPDEDAMIRSVE